MESMCSSLCRSKPTPLMWYVEGAASMWSSGRDVVEDWTSPSCLFRSWNAILFPSSFFSHGAGLDATSVCGFGEMMELNALILEEETSVAILSRLTTERLGCSETIPILLVAEECLYISKQDVFKQTLESLSLKIHEAMACTVGSN